MSKTTWDYPTFRQLAPEDAVHLLDTAPGTIVLPIAEFVHASGLGLTDTIRELQSGRLIARGKPDGQGGFTDLCITFEAILNWIRNPETPISRVRKFRKGIETCRTRPRQRLPDTIRPGLIR